LRPILRSKYHLSADYEGLITRLTSATAAEKHNQPDQLSDAGGAALWNIVSSGRLRLISPHDPETLYHAGNASSKRPTAACIGMRSVRTSRAMTRATAAFRRPITSMTAEPSTTTRSSGCRVSFGQERDLGWNRRRHRSNQRDAGKNWTTSPEELPEWSRISQIEASPFDAGRPMWPSTVTRTTIFIPNNLQRSWTTRSVRCG